MVSGEGHAPTLRDYGRVLWRRKWIVVLCAVLAPAAAVALSVRQASVYEASSQVLLNQTNLAALLTGVGAPPSSTDPARLAQTQADLASVPAVARRVLTRVPDAHLTPDKFLNDSSVTARSDADMLDFSVRNGDPTIAERLASAYALEYTVYRGRIDTAAAQRALAEAQQHLAALRARGEDNTPLYASLDEKAQTLQTLEALQTSNATVVRDASRATKVSPKPVRNGLLAFALGLILGVGLAFLRETLDTRVRSGDEIAAALHLPLLARLPAPPRRLASKRELATVAEPSSPAAEGFRVLRTNLDFVNLQKEVRSFVVTSAVEGEGKSTTAANLAVTLARAGRHVILADLDLRKPAVHAFFGLDQRLGLTNVALGELGLDEALRQGLVHGEAEQTFDPARPAPGGTNGHGDPNAALASGTLRVLASGPLPPDPGEFVQTPAVQRVLSELQHRAEIVVVDAPPLLGVGDALTVSSFIGGIVLVARLTTLRRPLLRELRRVLDATPAAKLGFVLAGAESEQSYGAVDRGYYRMAETREWERAR